MKHIAIITTAFLLFFTSCKPDRPDSDSTGSNAGAPPSEQGVEDAEGGTVIRDSSGHIIKTGPEGKVIDPGRGENSQYANGEGSGEQPYYISGKLKNGAGGTVILDKLDMSSVKPLYSQTINKEEQFNFEGAISEPTLFQLRLPAGRVHLIIMPGDTITFYAELEHPENYQVVGSLESLHLREMYEILEKANVKKRALEDKINNTTDKAVLSRLYDLRPGQYAQIEEEKYENLKKFITKIDTSFTAILASLYLKPDKDIEFLAKLDNKFAGKYPNSPFYKSLHEKVVAYGALMIGKVAPEIMSESLQGKTLRLSDFRGKYVLIDFWASWCVPCRNANPKMKKIYDKYKNKGFEIFGVSFDDNKNNWVKAIEEDKINWVQVSDLTGFKASTAGTYIISAIPSTVLIDKEGRIIAKNLSPEELDKKLAQLLK